MPIEVIHALALIKKCAARVNSSHSDNNTGKELLLKEKALNIIKELMKYYQAILMITFLYMCGKQALELNLI